MKKIKIKVLSNQWDGYELIDCGNFRKLERFGEMTIIRTEPKAWWKPNLKKNHWDKAVAICNDDGNWKFLKKNTPRKWQVQFNNIILEARFTNMSKHVGIFPEQSPHWQWMQNKINNTKNKKPHLLNLFGYTGAASLACVASGYSVTHVDASKPAIAWAKKNQKIAKLNNKPIRWILDDAIRFCQREIRREKKYDAIILDPPSFGRGPNGEVWKAEEHLPQLLTLLKKLLSQKPIFIIITMYSLDASSLMIGNILQDMTQNMKGQIETGELVHQITNTEKCLPLSLYGRWEA